MALDGVLLSCIYKELEENIIGGRIHRIHQPEKDEIHISLRSKNENYKLLATASPNFPRIHLTTIQKDNPITPPVFCMVLRKHLLGGRIVSILQPNFERILIIYIENRNELGDLSRKKLVIEIMGRHSNIILVDENNIIIDSIKHISQDVSRVRQVLPGLEYEYPPSQNKSNPLLQTKDNLERILNIENNPKKAARVIFSSFTGISPMTAREMVHRADEIIITGKEKHENNYKNRLILSFQEFFQKVNQGNFKPSILKNESGRPMDIFPFPYKQYALEMQSTFSSVSHALDVFYNVRDKIDRGRQRASHLLRVVNTNLDRAEKKQGILTSEYEKAQNADKYKLFGELLTANIYQISKGADKIQVQNYYSPNNDLVEIKLDKQKTPSENAQFYYKKYNKAKKALKAINKQLKETKDEIQYLEIQLENLSKCTEESEIQEIRQELIQEGYIRARSSKKLKRKLPESKPHHFISSQGFDIFVGKNNIQNDRLTLRTAEPTDIWLHTKEIPGSHVIIKSKQKELPEQTLLEAGVLAAYYSKAKHSSNVPVDYCPRKNVRKPSGAKPGMVIYDNYKTMFITPKEEIVNKLEKVQ